MSGHIPWSKVDIWLQGYRSIWLSTTRPDGRPHCVPVWYLWQADDRHAYIATHRTSVKANNLAHQPWVVLCAGNADDTIILQGRAHAVTDPAERERIDQFWQAKYVDPFSGARATVMEEDSPLYRVEVQHVMCWEYGVIATRTDWRFERA
jgi:PPOX class probable F420-dependent enzyme